MSWSKYVARHNEIAARIREGASLDRCLVYSATQYLNSQRIPVGGFADRIKGILFLLACAVATDRAFFIDWADPTPLSNTYRPRDIDWRAPTQLLEQRQSGLELNWIDGSFSEGVKKAVEQGALEEEVFGGKAVVTVLNNMFLPALLAKSTYRDVLASYELNASVSSEMIPAIFGRLFRFSPSGAVAEKYAAFDRFLSQHQNVVGVQFRTGGDGVWRDPLMDDRRNATRVAGAAIAKAQELQSSAFFVTTDSVLARDELCKALAPHGATFIFDVEPVHIDRPENQSALHYDFVAAEFAALSACDVVIHGSGGFGSFAAHAGGIPAIHYSTLAPAVSTGGVFTGVRRRLAKLFS